MGVPKPGGAVFGGSEVANRSVTLVAQSVNLGGGEVLLCVSAANFGQDVCVCVCVCVGGGGGLSTWVGLLGGQPDAKPS